MSPLLLAVALALSSSSPSLSPTPADAALLTGAAAQGAAGHAGADVVTSQDLKNALDLEAQKQMAACGEAASCLAEIAQALDAQVVVSASVATLDDDWVLQVSAYDARAASSAGRRTLQAPSRKELAAAAQQAGHDLIEPLLVGRTATEKLRVLVLDVVVAGGVPAPVLDTAAAPSNFGGLAVAGGVVLGLGALALGAGVACDLWVTQTTATDVATANLVRTASAGALVGYIGGGVLAAVGAGLLVYDGVVPDER